jgi:hypothetical protein
METRDNEQACRELGLLLFGGTAWFKAHWDYTKIVTGQRYVSFIPRFAYMYREKWKKQP